MPQLMQLKPPGLILIGMILASVVALVITGHAVEGMGLSAFLGGLLIPSPIKVLTAKAPEEAP